MIDGKKDGEVKVCVHGFLYVQEDKLDELAQMMTANVFRPMAREGKLHNVLMETTVIREQIPIPIFEDEETNHENRDSETRIRRLAQLEGRTE